MKEAIALLDGDANGPTSAGVSALTGAALLAIELGDLESADQYVDRSVDTARSSPNSPGLASALYAAGLLASQRGDNARAGTLLHQALERARIELDAQSEAGILGELAQVAFRTGNPPLAEAIELDRLAQCRRLSSTRWDKGRAPTARDESFSDFSERRLERQPRSARTSSMRSRLSTCRALGPRLHIVKRPAACG